MNAFAQSALVLSGGGSRGSYESGVIKQLYDSGKKFDRVYGTSIGALNAATLAFKGPDYLADFWQNIKSRDQVLASHYVDGIFQGGLFTLTPTEELLKKIIPNSQENVIPLPTVCATNINSGGSEYFTYSGDSEAFINGVIASASFPGVIIPRVIGDSHYVDGGIRNNTPLNQAILDGATEITVIMCMPLTQDPSDRYIFPGTFMTIDRIPSVLLRSLDILEQQVFTADVFDCIDQNEKPEKTKITLKVYAPDSILGTTFDFVQADLLQEFKRGYSEKPLDLDKFYTEMNTSKK